MMYGLIGYPLSHSFSQRYFTEKFAKEERDGYSYRNFPITDIDKLRGLLEQHPCLCGFNVTIPYKEQIIPYIDEMDVTASDVRAVNTVRVVRCGDDLFLKGYNTDVYGFRRSLEEWFVALDVDLPQNALVLGSGGASKAVVCALSGLGIAASVVSRREGKMYEQLNAKDFAACHLIVNTTPLGMFPKVGECPAIPYQYLTERHYLYDLVYNPEETVFMLKGIERGALVHNGKRMLHLQADKAWEIWNL